MKQVKIFNNDFSTTLTDIDGIKFLSHVEEDVDVQPNTQEINGVDGVLLGPSTFGPFNLVLNFSFKGVDTEDYRLVKQKIRGLIYRREPFFIWHSDMPGKKYAVYCEENAIDDLTSYFGTFAISFVVYKGYSESLYDTDQFSLIDGKWQFESGLVPDNTISYKHNRSLFDIYNGSHDTIDPRHGHRLKIRVRLATDTGFKLVNKATGDVFEYKGSLKANQSFILDGGYAYKDEKRCGRQTNHGIITLAPGYNTFEVWGKISNFEIEFIFPFIYR